MADMVGVAHGEIGGAELERRAIATLAKSRGS